MRFDRDDFRNAVFSRTRAKKDAGAMLAVLADITADALANIQAQVDRTNVQVRPIASRDDWA